VVDPPVGGEPDAVAFVGNHVMDGIVIEARVLRMEMDTVTTVDVPESPGPVPRAEPDAPCPVARQGTNARSAETVRSYPPPPAAARKIEGGAQRL
jgi:hypothetical protein